MSTLTLTMRQEALPKGRISLAGLIPSKLAGLSESEISKLMLRAGRQTIELGDVFAVSGRCETTLVISGATDRCDDIASRLDGGSVIVEGDIGCDGGRRMKGGRLEVNGSAGPYLASKLSGGLVFVTGAAGDHLGGVKAGEKFGMAGGTVVVEGDVGARAGDRMRRGTIITRGRFGQHAASRMMGGTLWTETGFGSEPGPLLRRGTLIGPSVEKFLPTFVPGGRHDLGVLRILSRHMEKTLGPLAPKPLPDTVRKVSGDMATIGKGEILLFG